jgi:hypothetical protein
VLPTRHGVGADHETCRRVHSDGDLGAVIVGFVRLPFAMQTTQGSWRLCFRSESGTTI